MSSRPAAWRGERRLRLAVEIGARSIRIASVWLVQGPAVQLPQLTRDLVVRVDVDGEPVLVQEFDDPRIARAIAPPDGEGHHYGLEERGVIEVDVPVPGDRPASDVVVRVADVSVLRDRPVDPTALAALFDAPPPGVRLRPPVGATDIRAHADFEAVMSALAGGATSPARFEVYRDESGEFRWRLLKSGGEIVADSGEGYPTRADCEADLQWIRANAADVLVTSADDA